jgi:hypothetical protein
MSLTVFSPNIQAGSPPQLTRPGKEPDSTMGSAPLNPFRIESPEKLAAQELVSLFVDQYTQVGTVKQRKHTIIWGSRGSGKSMLLRYLEPQCQALVHGSIEALLTAPESFVAIYCPCKEGQFNKTDLELLGPSAAQTLTEHMLNMQISDVLLNCFRTQFPLDLFSTEQKLRLAKYAVSLFDQASIATSMTHANSMADSSTEPLEWFQAVCQQENRAISNFLRAYALKKEEASYGGATSGYHDYLLPLMRAVQRLLARAIPVYVLIDDADKLGKQQQSIVNSWVANRDHSVVCFKISAQRDGYKTLLTRDGGLIEQPHDYSEVDVDALYTRSKSDYYEKVKLISERRLDLSTVPTKDIIRFLPSDTREDELLEQFKDGAAEEWGRVGEPGRQRDFVYRYASARLFQYLRDAKQRKSYAGFNNMVHLSSGVVRDFLEPCYLMFDLALSRAIPGDVIKSIPPAIQNEVLYNYSEEFLLSKFESLRKGLPPEDWSTLDSLRALLESLGRLFYERLHDPDAREARLFSFTVRGPLPSDLADILRLGVRYRYFQLRTYSSKEGGGRENWYILNRRLCPVFKLDPTGFEGRISLTSDLLRLACQDPGKFVKLRLRKQHTSDEQPAFEFEEQDNGVQLT